MEKSNQDKVELHERLKKVKITSNNVGNLEESLIMLKKELEDTRTELSRSKAKLARADAHIEEIMGEREKVLREIQDIHNDYKTQIQNLKVAMKDQEINIAELEEVNTVL